MAGGWLVIAWLALTVSLCALAVWVRFMWRTMPRSEHRHGISGARTCPDCGEVMLARRWDAHRSACPALTVAEWLEDLPWIRCGACGEVGDAADPERPSYRVEVEGGRVVSVACGRCAP